VKNVEHCEAIDGVVAAFVVGFDEGADQAGDDHDPIHEGGEDDSGPTDAAGEKDVHEQEGGCDEAGERVISIVLRYRSKQNLYGILLWDLLDLDTVAGDAWDPEDKGRHTNQYIEHGKSLD